MSKGKYIVIVMSVLLASTVHIWALYFLQLFRVDIRTFREKEIIRNISYEDNLSNIDIIYNYEAQENEDLHNFKSPSINLEEPLKNFTSWFKSVYGEKIDSYEINIEDANDIDKFIEDNYIVEED